MMAGSPILFWCFLAGIFLLTLTIYAIRNKTLSKKWKSSLDADTAKSLTQLIWSRTFQLLIMMAIGLMTIAFYNTKLNTTSAPTPPPPPDSLAQENYYPPIVTDDTLAIPSQSISNANNIQSIDDIFNAGKNTPGAQTTIDSLKIRYEEILVTHFFLKKCEKTNPSDYQLIISALVKEIEKLQAPARLQYDILTAAQGSYQELYAKSNCDRSDAKNVYGQYQRYIEHVSKKQDQQSLHDIK